MSYSEDPGRLWRELAWIDDVYERWEQFFGSLMDQPERAEALCSLGLSVLRGEAVVCPQSASSRWMGFFTAVAGRPHKARALCALGLELVRREAIPCNETFRGCVRSILLDAN